VAFLVSVKIVVLLAMREEEGGGHVKSQKWEKKCPIVFSKKKFKTFRKDLGIFGNTWNNSDHTKKKEEKVNTSLCVCIYTSRRRHTIPRKTNPKLNLSQYQPL